MSRVDHERHERIALKPLGRLPPFRVFRVFRGKKSSYSFPSSFQHSRVAAVKTGEMGNRCSETWVTHLRQVADRTHFPMSNQDWVNRTAIAMPSAVNLRLHKETRLGSPRTERACENEFLAHT